MKKSHVLSIAPLALALNLLGGCGSDSNAGDAALGASGSDAVAAEMTADGSTVAASSDASQGTVLDIEEAARRRGRYPRNPASAPAPTPAPSPAPAPTAPSPSAPAPSQPPSSEAPTAPAPSSPVSTAARQFASGFEAGVSLPAATNYGNSDQQPQGGDVPGYSFPLNLWSTPQQWRSWILSVVGSSTPLRASEYATAQIQTVTGRDGNPTRAMALVSKAKSPSTDVQQITLQNYGMGVEPVMYQRMWVKFGQDTLDRAKSIGSRDFYQIFWEVKAEPDYRLRLQLRYSSDGKLYWHTQGDVLSNANPIWESDLRSVPVVMAPDSSASGWHKVEVWMNRPGGKFKVTIDGSQLIDYSGKLMGNSGNRVDQLKLMMLYSTVSPLTKTLFDDLEIWSSVPSDAWKK